MTGFGAAVAVEWLKFRRSRVPLGATVALLVGVPTLGTAGLAAAASDAPTSFAGKARTLIVGTGWEALFGLAGQVSAVGVLLATGIVIGWIFGREFADGTVVGLFAQPVTRGRIAAAKSLVVALWLGTVSLGIAALTMLGGAGLGWGWPPMDAAARLAILSLLTGLSVLPIGWVASIYRGYLPAFVALLGVVIATQLAVGLGAGAWVPWAAPSLWAGAAGPEQAAQVTAAQLALPALVGMGGVAATVAWWRRAQLGNASG